MRVNEKYNHVDPRFVGGARERKVHGPYRPILHLVQHEDTWRLVAPRIQEMLDQRLQAKQYRIDLVGCDTLHGYHVDESHVISLRIQHGTPAPSRRPLPVKGVKPQLDVNSMGGAKTGGDEQIGVTMQRGDRAVEHAHGRHSSAVVPLRAGWGEGGLWFHTSLIHLGPQGPFTTPILRLHRRGCGAGGVELGAPQSLWHRAARCDSAQSTGWCTL